MEKSSKLKNLTLYPEASLQEVCVLCLPLLFTFLSANVTIFLDRIFLARYSLAVMNATVVSVQVVTIFYYATITIASAATVFVGHYNGAGKYKEIGNIVWQMIWFSLFTVFIYWPVGFFGGPYLVSNHLYGELGVPYFKWMMFFGPSFPLVIALSAFFIGRGKVLFVTYLTVATNIFSVFLAYFLVFGAFMGAKGVAIATGIAHLLQALILFVLFFSKENQKIYNTFVTPFNKEFFYQCLFIGFPAASCRIITIIGWWALAKIMLKAGSNHMTIFAIGQSLFYLFYSVEQALQKTSLTISSNLFGKEKKYLISKLFFSSSTILLVFVSLFSIPFLMFPEVIIHFFLSKENVANTILIEQLRLACLWIWIFCIVDGLSWNVISILTAAGDVVTVFFMHMITIITFLIIPAYTIFSWIAPPPHVIWLVVACYGAMHYLVFFTRYKSHRWEKHLHYFAQVS